LRLFILATQNKILKLLFCCSSLTQVFSVGLPHGKTEVDNVAASIELSIDPVFAYLDAAEKAETSVSKTFTQSFARSNGHQANSVITVNPNKDEDEEQSSIRGGGGGAAPAPPPKEELGFFAKIFGGGSKAAAEPVVEKKIDD